MKIVEKYILSLLVWSGSLLPDLKVWVSVCVRDWERTKENATRKWNDFSLTREVWWRVCVSNAIWFTFSHDVKIFRKFEMCNNRLQISCWCWTFAKIAKYFYDLKQITISSADKNFTQRNFPAFSIVVVVNLCEKKRYFKAKKMTENWGRENLSKNFPNNSSLNSCWILVSRDSPDSLTILTRSHSSTSHLRMFEYISCCLWNKNSINWKILISRNLKSLKTWKQHKSVIDII